MNLPDDFQYPIPNNINLTDDQEIINFLKSENAYLRGVIKAYEKFLRSNGYIKEEEE